MKLFEVCTRARWWPKVFYSRVFTVVFSSTCGFRERARSLLWSTSSSPISSRLRFADKMFTGKRKRTVGSGMQRTSRVSQQCRLNLTKALEMSLIQLLKLRFEGHPAYGSRVALIWISIEASWLKKKHWASGITKMCTRRGRPVWEVHI